MSFRAVAALAAATAGAVLLTACGGPGPEKHTAKAFGRAGERLTVTAKDAALELVPYDGTDIAVDRWVKGTGTKAPKATWSRSGDTLKLQVHCSGISIDCGGRFRVRVPRSTALTVDSNGGGVKAKGFASSLHLDVRDGGATVDGLGGALRASSSGGNLTVRNVHGDADVTARDGSAVVEQIGGTLRASSNGGNLAIHGARKAVRLDARDGGVTADGLRGPVTATTSGGNADLVFSAAPSRVAVSSRDGGLTVKVPKDGTRYRVTGSSEDGNRSVQVPTGGGAAHTLDLSSSGGNLAVRTGG